MWRKKKKTVFITVETNMYGIHVPPRCACYGQGIHQAQAPLPHEDTWPSVDGHIDYYFLDTFRAIINRNSSWWVLSALEIS